MDLPCAALDESGTIVAVFWNPEGFVGPNGLQHFGTVWTTWGDEDWERLCPGWAKVPVIDTPPVDPARIIERLPVSAWTVDAAGVHVAYRSTAKTAQQIIDDRSSAETALLAGYTAAVQAHLDAVALGRDYDDMKSCVTYADADPAPTGNAVIDALTARFKADGVAARNWRSLVWATCYALLAEIRAETRPVPSVDELIAELPTLTWPA